MCFIKACALVKGRWLQEHLHSTPGYSVNMLFNQVLQEQSNKFLLPNLPSAPLLWSLFPFVLFPSSIFAASKSMYPSKLNLWLFWAAFRFFLAESLEEEAAGDSLEAAAAALAARKAVFFPLFQDFVAVRGSSATVPSWHTIVSDSVGNNPTRTWPSGIMATTLSSRTALTLCTWWVILFLQTLIALKRT